VYIWVPGIPHALLQPSFSFIHFSTKTHIMKRIPVLLLIFLLAGMTSYSQKKSGTIFSEHEAIGKTKAVWQAFINGEEETYRSFFADSAYEINNSNPSPKKANKDIGKGTATWHTYYDNLKVEDDKPAYPDALEYKEGGLWVQDWLRMTGIHKKTGIVLNLPIHNLYSFNDEGKITAMISYFENDVFQEISASQNTRENGKVYINHPYIVIVRKGMNAFVARDLDTWSSFYSPKARFSNSMAPYGTSVDMDEYKASISDMFFKDDLKYDVEQVGYPDCIYYEKNNYHVVYSWWKMKTWKDGKKYEFPFMITHDFNEEGKITYQRIYVSSNHLEHL